MKGDEGRAFGGERRGRYEGKGTSGPRGMNQAEQTLNFEIRYRRTKATHHWRPNRGYARGTPWPITILHSPVTPPRAASLSGNWPPPPSRQLENSIYTYIYIYIHVANIGSGEIRRRCVCERRTTTGDAKISTPLLRVGHLERCPEAVKTKEF